MKLFDLHCDTPTRMLSLGAPLFENDCHVSLNKSACFDSYAQIMAVFSSNHLSDEAAYLRFFEVVENLKKEILKNDTRARLISSGSDIEPLWNQNVVPFILAVEDARILQNDTSRLDILHSLGVRILTLNWSGKTCIGGAHDTDDSLSDFGKSVVKKCFSLGIVPDVSHASFKGTHECIRLAKHFKKPIIASHSNSYSVCPHSRNLKDEDFKEISSLGGIVGISLCPQHLSLKKEADTTDIIRHIEHYLSLGGENTVCLGCDLDGTDLPTGFDSITDIKKIEKELLHLGYKDDIIEKIFYKNALNFAKNNI